MTGFGASLDAAGISLVEACVRLEPISSAATAVMSWLALRRLLIMEAALSWRGYRCEADLGVIFGKIAVFGSRAFFERGWCGCGEGATFRGVAAGQFRKGSRWCGASLLLGGILAVLRLWGLWGVYCEGVSGKRSIGELAFFSSLRGWRN